jgi:hypothetical protein
MATRATNLLGSHNVSVECLALHDLESLKQSGGEVPAAAQDDCSGLQPKFRLVRRNTTI